MVTLRIETRRDLADIATKLVDSGLLSHAEQTNLYSKVKEFPFDMPIDIDAVAAFVAKPMVKPFKKGIAHFIGALIKA